MVVFREAGRDRVELQLTVDLNKAHGDKYARLRRDQVNFLLDLKSLLLKHPVQFALEDVPDLRRVRLRQEIYVDAWSKDLFWQRVSALRSASLDAAILIGRRLGDPAALLSPEASGVVH